MSSAAETANSSIESRICTLETRLGISPSTASVGDSDINSRLDRLFLLVSQASAPSSASKKSFDALSSIEKDWTESTKLASELDPGSFLVRQGFPPTNDTAAVASISTPMIYRRQEVLASSTFLKEGMDQLNKAREALLISSDIEKNPLPPNERYTQSDILSSPQYDYAMDESVQKRLNDVSTKIMSLYHRSANASQKMDELVDRYHAIMGAVSEKIVLADEEVTMLEKAKEEKTKLPKRGSSFSR
mmetsp:Transcript_9695/g.13578  ORF Transcript_9695/g.13578 Transcript_9695/m.13578 type:complete len:246 (-) Transcript_9695:103-840(-)|eukprot:CAMPEP_0185730838 /NCGR_PEP_ID=MMETSP1171-20130828/11137_1 /TAXON_ID=374046 /ORGANISM="Helicotheca tamensis, Strain CCMP826" /LENGTH=245 /DNA_ID=CAMNT_0028399973 /DNA_START=103 /DNA_END=840 /DNA_ORIENTATION=+